MKDPMSTNDMVVWTTIPISLAVAAPLLLLLLLLNNFPRWKNKTNSRRLPPGPPCWPLIGNLLDLGYHYKAPRERLVELREKYGPILMIRMSAVNILVVASADDAMQLVRNVNVHHPHTCVRLVNSYTQTFV
ncbi:hypothetical protein MKX01_012488 [Papaver californicum]|nr:hypothetical protein MKX01_012488 [Papaver californicum]